MPIIKGDARWGTFEVSFKAMHASLLAELWDKPVIKLLVFVVPIAFLGYCLMMNKTLRHLDPSAVVPERVKTALDAMNILTFFGRFQFSVRPEDHGLQIGHSMVYIQWHEDPSGTLGKQLVGPAEVATAGITYPIR